MKILFSNLGYARGIDGSLAQHLRYGYRHFYCPVPVQQQSLQQFSALLAIHQPDIGGLVEVESGSANSANFHQLEHLLDAQYPHFAIDNKYARAPGRFGSPISRGKSNAVFSRHEMKVERRLLDDGSKRLVYEVEQQGLRIFFAHYSLKRLVRARQFAQIRRWVEEQPDMPTLLLGDFNILGGVEELLPLVGDGRLRLANNPAHPTFTFHRHKRMVDLCLASPGLPVKVDVLPQPFSDHDALLVTVG